MNEELKKQAEDIDRRLTKLENEMNKKDDYIEIKPKRGRTYGDPVAEIEW